LDDESMTKKESCLNTEYTGGFKLTVDPDGTFVAVKGKNKLKANSAKELYELIKKFNQEHKDH
jgi:hypothetical protein